jgi:divalent metal cation (Fe/Co/Zn/Cd) transporter
LGYINWKVALWKETTALFVLEVCFYIVHNLLKYVMKSFGSASLNLFTKKHQTNLFTFLSILIGGLLFIYTLPIDNFSDWLIIIDIVSNVCYFLTLKFW